MSYHHLMGQSSRRQSSRRTSIPNSLSGRQLEAVAVRGHVREFPDSQRQIGPPFTRPGQETSSGNLMPHGVEHREASSSLGQFRLAPDRSPVFEWCCSIRSWAGAWQRTDPPSVSGSRKEPGTQRDNDSLQHALRDAVGKGKRSSLQPKTESQIDMKTNQSNDSFQSVRVSCSKAKTRLLSLALLLCLSGSAWAQPLPFDLTLPDVIGLFRGSPVAHPGPTPLGPPIMQLTSDQPHPAPSPDGTPYAEPPGRKK
jgi:hypothetical protein